jgi:ribosome biogenesis protein SSF1/2
MAGPLGITHLLLFSRSASGNTNLRIALTPRGPTLNFKVERYSLCKDVRRALKHPQSGEREHKTPPLLVMNNFLTNTETESGDAAGNGPEGKEEDKGKAPRHLESLTTTVFQSLFPPISPQNTPLSSIRRVLLLNRELSTSGANGDVGTYTINLRHYAITTRTSGVSRGVRKLDRLAKSASHSRQAKKGLPDLGKLQDVSEFLLDPANAGGFTSGSESEGETDGEVEVMAPKTTKVLNRRKWEALKRRQADGAERGSKPTEPEEEGEADEANDADSTATPSVHSSKGNVEKRAIQLTELGPRLRLRLVKVEEGVCGGKVMWHEFVSKTKAEEKELERRWGERRRIKEERKKKQKEDVERKRKEREARGEAADGDEGEEDEDEEDWEDELEDVEMEDE